MHSLYYVVFIAILLDLTAALPHLGLLAIPIHKRSSLTRNGIVDLESARSHIARKYSEGLVPLQRRNGVTSFSSGSTLTRRATSADLLIDDEDMLWYGTISVGSPAVEYTVAFDTGSADLFLPASNCGSTCDGHTLYNPNASSSAVDLHQNASLAYDGGSSTVPGELYTDTVNITGFIATNQTLVAASQYASNFQASKFAPDGLMGLAFRQLSEIKASPVIQTLISEGQLSDPVFAFKLASSGSELRIGGVNTALYTDPITYTPVTQQGYWQIALDSINGNGQAVLKNVTAIVDTGTTLIAGDTAVVGQFYSALNATAIGGGYYTMPCNAMPNVSITIGGTTFAISAETFNFGTYNSSENSCVGAITAESTLGNTWILGDAFLRNVYSIFDVGKPQVGFAALA